MDHREANRLLTELVSGGMDPARRGKVERHVAGCAECRAWVDTFRLFETSPCAGGEASASRHPPSRDLADFALSAPGLEPAVRQRCARHVERCSECAQEEAMARAAVSGSREVPAAQVVPMPRRRSYFRTPLRLACAASVLLLFGALAASRLLSPTPVDYRLRGGALEGEQTIEARRSIVVDFTELRSGAALTLRSGEKVVFGDGFSVRSGASLEVVVEKR